MVLCLQTHSHPDLYMHTSVHAQHTRDPPVPHHIHIAVAFYPLNHADPLTRHAVSHSVIHAHCIHTVLHTHTYTIVECKQLQTSLDVEECLKNPPPRPPKLLPPPPSTPSTPNPTPPILANRGRASLRVSPSFVGLLRLTQRNSTVPSVAIRFGILFPTPSSHLREESKYSFQKQSLRLPATGEEGGESVSIMDWRHRT